MRRRLLNFKSNKSIILHVLRQPNSREMSPSKFLDDHVSIHHDLANVNSMVAPNFIVRHSFVLWRVVDVHVICCDFVSERRAVPLFKPFMRSFLRLLVFVSTAFVLWFYRGRFFASRGVWIRTSLGYIWFCEELGKGSFNQSMDFWLFGLLGKVEPSVQVDGGKFVLYIWDFLKWIFKGVVSVRHN